MYIMSNRRDIPNRLRRSGIHPGIRYQRLINYYYSYTYAPFLNLFLEYLTFCSDLRRTWLGYTELFVNRLASPTCRLPGFLTRM